MATLSEKLSQLTNPTPVLEDPEDEELRHDTSAKVVDNWTIDDDDDDSPTKPTHGSLRVRSGAFLDELESKYAGKKVSLKKLRHQWGNEPAEKGAGLDDESHLLDADPEDGDQSSSDEGSYSPEDEEEREDYVEEEGEGKEVEDEEGEQEGEIDEEESMDIEGDESAVKHISVKPNEIQKGAAVRAQLAIWDTLLEARIKIQKIVSAANRLPQHDVYTEFTKHEDGGKEFQSAAQQTQSVLKKLLDKMLSLEADLTKRNKDMKGVENGEHKLGKPDESDEEISSDSENEKPEGGESDGGYSADESPNSKPSLRKQLKLSEYSEIIADRHKSFMSYRNDTIQLWNDKTRVASGKIGAKNFNAFEQPTLTQIQHILNDEHRLIKRTQLRRSTYRVLGKRKMEPEEEEGEGDQDEEVPPESNVRVDATKDYDIEIFDDDDFYHQLLRELIEKKTAGVSDPVVLSRQWLSLQSMRSKLKKKVDTKASKGRKIKYNVHPKLVNFMAPVDTATFTEDAKSELFKSLFGKII